MRNIQDAISTFEGIRPSKAASITSTADAIWSYSTCIATRKHGDGTGRVIINVTKYSVTTSRLQNALKQEYPNAILVSPLEKGCTAQDLRNAAHTDALLESGESDGDIRARLIDSDVGF